MLARSLLLVAIVASAARGQIPITGIAVPGMASYDSVITSLMKRYEMPGGAVAVVKDGKLVYARGFGWADVENRVAVEPQALFRIASVSKPITAAAVFALVEARKLHLSDKAFALLPGLIAPAGSKRDSRLGDITIEMLLQHAGGWDRDKSFDPMFIPERAAAAVGVPRPAGPNTIIRYMLGQPLQFDPGRGYNYSNFGYTVLGRIIEHVSGMSYERFVHSAVLDPAGARGMRIGHTRLSERADGEVKYYAVGGEPFAQRVTTSVFPGEGQVPEAYGGFYVEAMDAHGAWISSTIDLLRFLTAVDGLATRKDILKPESIKQMTARPPDNPAWTKTSYWYADGWLVRPAGSDANWWHNGSLPGTSTLMVRANNGVAWVALFNARAKDSGFDAALDQGMWTALKGVTAWPSHDLFASY
jgi:CubicO group peptidase (beta-lactamase class C family)